MSRFIAELATELSHRIDDFSAKPVDHTVHARTTSDSVPIEPETTRPRLQSGEFAVSYTFQAPTADFPTGSVLAIVTNSLKPELCNVKVRVARQ